MVVTASLSAVPGVRLNDTVTAGSWPRWFTLSGITLGAILVTEVSGTKVATLVADAGVVPGKLADADVEAVLIVPPDCDDEEI